MLVQATFSVKDTFTYSQAFFLVCLFLKINTCPNFQRFQMKREADIQIDFWQVKH